MPGSQPPPQSESASDPDAHEQAAAPGRGMAGPANGAPMVAVAVARGAEGDGVLRVPVRLSPAADRPVTAAYATANGSATAGADYQAASGVLTFAAGAAGVQHIEVVVHDDAIAEGDESFLVRLGEVAGAAVAAAQATVTVADNDVPRVTVEPRAITLPEGGSASYRVALGSRPTGTVTVTATAGLAEVTMAPRVLEFPPGDWAAAQTVTVTAAADEDAVADEPAQVTHAVAGGGYDGAAAPAIRVTIVEADVATLAVAGVRGSEQAGSLRFAVTLSAAAARDVTVEYATGDDGASAGEDYRGASGTLSFTAGTTAARTIDVVVLDDELDEPEERFTVTLRNAGAPLAGGAQTMAVHGTIEDDDAPPQLSIADATASEAAPAASVRFAVALQPVSGRTVAVAYATADDTATAGADYEAVSGMLTFPAGSSERTIAVPVTDDRIDEAPEEFTVTLSGAVNATLASARRTATGTIEDDDEAPRLDIADATASEMVDGSMRFTVTLQPASSGAVTVDYATADDTATAGADYTAASGTLTFPAGTTVQTIAVAVVDDQEAELPEYFTVTLSNASGAGVSVATATGTIVSDEAPLELSALSVTSGSRSMYPAFDGDIHHYAVRCTRRSTVSVSATAAGANTSVTLRRANSDDDLVATGSLPATQLTVADDHDIVLELGDADDTVTYVVHCAPLALPWFRVLSKRPEVSDGLLLVTPKWDAADPKKSYMAIVDNNGVPRFHLRKADGARNFRRFADGRYSVHAGNDVHLHDRQLEYTKVVRPVPPLSSSDPHDFLITETGNYLFIGYVDATRDRCEVSGCEPGTEDIGTVTDSWIQETTPAGEKVFEWNSWDHLKLSDCRFVFGDDYAHLNSLHLADGDIVASFRHCNMVVRIDRSGGTGRLVWQVGGTAPPRDTATQYLAITGDTDARNEFCGQHSATLTSSGSLLVFDNGHKCNGPRKDLAKFTRVVEYRLLTSGTPKEARFWRQYLLPAGNGSSNTRGGVVSLANGHWLIAWGTLVNETKPLGKLLAISEVDPNSGTPVLELASVSIPESRRAFTYRAYRVSGIEIPLNLP